MVTKLRLTGRQHAQLEQHLFPGDGAEAVAVIACGRACQADSQVITAHDIFLVPHDSCRRSASAVSWSPACVAPLLERASKSNQAILKIHSHPGGYDRFSETDDAADKDFFGSVFGWTDTDDCHVSAIMLPGGSIRARTVDTLGGFGVVELVAVAGNDRKRSSKDLLTVG